MSTTSTRSPSSACIAADRVTDGTGERQAIRHADEAREALADASIRVHDEHANGLGRASHHGAASTRRVRARHRRMSCPDPRRMT